MKVLPEYTDDREWINKAFLDRKTVSMMAWNNLVNKDFIIKHELYFVDRAINEDELWHFLLSKYVTHLAILCRNTYMYVIREGSIMHDISKETEVKRNWLFLLGYMIGHCGGRFLKNEVSAIFHYVLSITYCYEDKILINGVEKMLVKMLRYASLKQKIGISLYILAPQMLRNRIHFRNMIYNIVGQIS